MSANGRPAALLDVDGTLVDTTYHHAVAWARAFMDIDMLVPVWRLHRHVGMGSDQFVAGVCGDDVEREHGDEVRERHTKQFEEMIDEVQPFPGARELIVDLKERGHTVVLASSASEHEFEHYLDLLDARDVADAWTMSSDVEATKPDPDLVQTALDKAGGGAAVLVGDARWDCEAAQRAEIPTIGLLTGGFSEAELREAGAAAVFESLEDLRANLEGTPLGDDAQARAAG